ncbi:MAG TPA: hypothetical protein ENI76_08770, partial [Ignavibacteria bacterium]|nr:hypothetical protein [Ignavibacteria bacterium]
MIKKLLLVIASFCFFSTLTFSQPAHPKREFRGAWIATVVNLDWPSSNHLTTAQQKEELINILNGLKATGINSVIFQIRTECDALYNSPYEPWSYWLTGQQGKAPDPYYDPLKFAIQEAHKRGMELQAWFNPYRAVRQIGSYVLASNNVTKVHPSWIVTYGHIKVLNPGLPQVRAYITKIVMDVVRRYDIDGVHFDDYFYPYPNGTKFNDDKTFADYPNGYKAEQKADWRRNNVNLLIKMVHDSIEVVKPYVKFGISPFGIWKSHVPSGIVGLSSYNDLYADAVYWLQHKLIDYVAPQLYWPFGGLQDYGKLMNWWSTQTNGRQLYIGQAAFNINNRNWTASELPNQIKADRNNPNVQGSIMFRALAGILNNEKGFTDSLKNNYYKYPALLPVMAWKDTIKPNMPRNLKITRLAGTGVSALKWDTPYSASDGDTTSRYVVYAFKNASVQKSDIDNAANIFDVTGENYEIPTAASSISNSKVYFGITSLNRNSVESSISNIVEIMPPQKILLASPTNDAINQRDTVLLKWKYTNGAAEYKLQVSSEPAFKTGLIYNKSGLIDTFAVVTNFAGLSKYYWRVQAQNIADTGSYSNLYSFITGFPKAPILISPEHSKTGVSVNPTLVWSSADSAKSYELQLSGSLTFDTSTIKLDSVNIRDTSITLINLSENTIYFWRVRAENQYGIGNWSAKFGFKTSNPTLVQKENGLPLTFRL